MMQAQRYFPPTDHPLHRYVASIWRIDSEPLHTYETILPKQNVDLLFNLRGPQHALATAGSLQYTLRDFHIAGPQTGALTCMPQGSITMVGISLKMDGSSALLNVPMTELTDQTVEGCSLLPHQRFLWEQVAEAPDFAAQCDLLMRWLTTALTPSPQLDLVQRACWALRAEPTSRKLDEVAAHLHLSSRHLRRLMLRYVGVGPAQYMRLSRFAKALYLMPQAASLTDVAYGVHYADQAHFCRDFKEIAGMTPNEYRQRASHVPGHIFTK